MLKSQVVDIVVVIEGNALGETAATQFDKSVTYTDKAMKIVLS